MSLPKVVGRYEIVRRLGKSMSEVYLAIDSMDGRRVALKLVRLEGGPASQALLEAEQRGAAIQQELRAVDPRMVEIYEYGEQDRYFYVAMQYLEGRNLAEVLRAEGILDAIRAAAIALEVCEQLAKFHVHPVAVVHGDIKPSNIHLGENETVRLLDFGIAKALATGQNATSHEFGSPGYCAPERLSRSVVDAQSDLWGLGATLYEMLAGAPPYQADDTRLLERLIRSRRAPRALPANCPRALKSVVMKALAPEPSRRYGSAREFQSDLQAFLERKPTIAELERRAHWGQSTIEAARATVEVVARTARRVRDKLTPAGAVASFAVGMTLWMAGELGWQKWKAHTVKAASVTLPAHKDPASPVRDLEVARRSGDPPHIEDDLPKLYAAAGERILAEYRRSADTNLSHYDWHKAEVLLERAVDGGAKDDHTQGELALSRGFAAIERLESGRYSEASAATLEKYAREQFSFAAKRMPDSTEAQSALRELALRRPPVAPKPVVKTAMVYRRPRRWR